MNHIIKKLYIDNDLFIYYFFIKSKINLNLVCNVLEHKHLKKNYVNTLYNLKNFTQFKKNYKNL